MLYAQPSRCSTLRSGSWTNGPKAYRGSAMAVFIPRRAAFGNPRPGSTDPARAGQSAVLADIGVHAFSLASFARMIKDAHAGVIAWVRSADLALGEFGHPEILVVYGDVPDME